MKNKDIANWMRIITIISVIGFVILFYFKQPINRSGLPSNLPTPVTEHYSTGEIRATGMTVNNLKQDTWVFYTIEGKIEKEVIFDKGEIVEITENK